MTEYRIAWLSLIADRDNFYLMVLLVVATAALWHKMSRGRLFAVEVAMALLAVTGLVGWGVWHLS